MAAGAGAAAVGGAAVGGAVAAEDGTWIEDEIDLRQLTSNGSICRTRSCVVSCGSSRPKER